MTDCGLLVGPHAEGAFARWGLSGTSSRGMGRDQEWGGFDAIPEQL